MRQRDKSSVLGCSRIISKICHQPFSLKQGLENMLVVHPPPNVVQCPPSSQDLPSAVFELGRGHICKELCPRDLFISHLSVWGGALARTKWHRGYKCLQLKPKSKEVNNMTWSKLYFQKQNTSHASISKIWNFITLAYFRDDEMMSFLCFFSLIFASKSLIH